MIFRWPNFLVIMPNGPSDGSKSVGRILNKLGPGDHTSYRHCTYIVLCERIQYDVNSKSLVNNQMFQNKRLTFPRLIFAIPRSFLENKLHFLVYFKDLGKYNCDFDAILLHIC